MVKITLNSDIPFALENAQNILEKDGWQKNSKNVYVNKGLQSQKEARERLNNLNLLLSSIITIHIEICHG